MKLSNKIKNEFYQQLSSLLKQAREDCGLTVEEGALLLNCRAESLENLETGNNFYLQHKSVGQYIRFFGQYHKMLSLSMRDLTPEEIADGSPKVLDECTVHELVGVLNKRLKTNINIEETE